MDNHIKKSILHNSLFIFTSKFIDTFGGIISLIILARFLNPGGLGEYAYILSIFLALQPIINLELDKITIRELAASEDKKQFIHNAAGLKTAMLLVFFLVSLLIIMFSTEADHLKTALILCLFSEIFIQYSILGVSVLIAFREAVYDSITNTLSKAFFIGWILAGWMLGKDITYVFWGYLFSNILRFLILTAFVHFRFIGIKLKYNADYIKHLIKECLPITIASFIIGLTFRIDIFVIRYFLGDAEIGLFYSIHKIILVIQIVPVSLINAFFPHLSLTARHNYAKFREYYSKTFDILFFTATSIIMFNLLFHREIISILYGKSYEDAGLGFIILVPVSLFLFLDYLNTISLTSLNRQKMLLYSGLAAFIVNIVLDLSLVPVIGMEGACIGTFFSYFTLFAVSFLCHPKDIIKKAGIKNNLLNLIVLVLLSYFSYRAPVESIPGRGIIMALYLTIIFFLYGLKDIYLQILSLYKDKQ